MAAYWIGEHAVTDPAKFESYLAKAIPIIERFGGRYLTRVGAHEVLDGNWRPNRVVVIEFPDMAAIRRSIALRNISPSLRCAEAQRLT